MSEYKPKFKPKDIVIYKNQADYIVKIININNSSYTYIWLKHPLLDVSNELLRQHSIHLMDKFYVKHLDYNQYWAKLNE